MPTLLCRLRIRAQSWFMLWMLMLGTVSAWAASEPMLDLGRPEIIDGQVALDVQLRGFFEEETLSSLESGAPVTLVFQWRLLQERSGRRDPVVAEGEVRNRIFFDVLEEQYHLFNHQGRPMGACDALAGLSETLCHRDDMVLTSASALEQSGRYYVEMEVILEILSDEQVRGFENWLLGDDAPVGVSLDLDMEEAEGLSEMVLGLVKRMSGLTATAARDESEVFSGRPTDD
jgi:hypothetical protein